MQILKYIQLLVLAATPIPLMSMDNEIDPFQPLQKLVIEFDPGNSVSKAFDDTFSLLCRVVVEKFNNSHEAKVVLENEFIKTQVDEIVKQLKEKYNQMYFESAKYDTLFSQPNNSPYLSKNYNGMALLARVQALEDARAQLYKKISTLIYILDEVIATSQQPPFLNEATLLKQAVEKQIWWKDLKSSGITAAYVAAGVVGFLTYDYIKRNC